MYIETVGRRKDSCEVATADNEGNIYYGLLVEGAVIKWNVTAMPLERHETVVIAEKGRLAWINSLFISEGDLWIVSNR